MTRSEFVAEIHKGRQRLGRFARPGKSSGCPIVGLRVYLDTFRHEFGVDGFD
jgi:hypothetical protein